MATVKIINGFSLTSLFQRPSRLCKGIILLMMLLVSPFFNVNSPHAMDYSVHANIIYHFTKYIDWPENRKSGDFIIGVIGETPLFDELKKIIASKKALNQKIVIRHFSPSQTTHSGDFTYSVRLLHSGKQRVTGFTDRNNPHDRQELPGFTLVNASAGYTWKERFTFFAKVENALNQHYRHPLSVELNDNNSVTFHGSLQDPLRVMAGLTFSLR